MAECECCTKSARAWFEACRAAEARVEALSEALREIANIATDLPHARRLDSEAMRRVARAALACPPQQRGE